MLNERKLKSGEKSKLKKLEDKVPMKPFKDQYGDEGESVYYATLTKMAKKTNEGIMDPYERLQAIKEAVEKLSFPEVQKEFEKRYGVNAKNKDNLVELSRKANAARNPKRAAMAKKILDMAKDNPDAFEDPASRK